VTANKCCILFEVLLSQNNSRLCITFYKTASDLRRSEVRHVDITDGTKWKKIKREKNKKTKKEGKNKMKTQSRGEWREIKERKKAEKK
jgi:hypothetical protein